jgi:hypothetical protein
MSKKASTDNELNQICVPTKTIYLDQEDPKTKIEIILRPFKQRHFSHAIAIINKYFDQFNSVREGYLTQRKGILDRYEDEATRILALEELDAGFNEGMEIGKAILGSGGEGIGEDIKAIVNMSISKATEVIVSDNGTGQLLGGNLPTQNVTTERAPVDLDLDDLTWGECLILLGSTVGLNMDFFAQNSKAMNLVEVMQTSEPSPKPTPKAGEKLSAA